MKIIRRKDWQAIIEGANLLGTGGGGTIAGAKNILGKIGNTVNLIGLDELQDKQLICTVFGVGGKQNCDPILASQKALAAFQKILKQDIAAIIPVENGPMAIANAMFIGSELSLPVLDSDIVGMRSSPEVYLETVSLPGLQRIPCVISDGKRTQSIIKKLSLQQLEKEFRDFAIASGGDAIVAGYPLLVKQVKDILPKESVTIALKNGKLLQELRSKKITFEQFCTAAGWENLGKGKIISVQRDTSKGFSEGVYVIADSLQTFKVFFKNENLVVTKNDETFLTCPDSISLVDTNVWQALNNFDINKNQEVIILAKKAIAIWRTEKGKKLFSPRKLGLNFKQKLL